MPLLRRLAPPGIIINNKRGRPRNRLFPTLVYRCCVAIRSRVDLQASTRRTEVRCAEVPILTPGAGRGPEVYVARRCEGASITSWTSVSAGVSTRALSWSTGRFGSSVSASLVACSPLWLWWARTSMRGSGGGGSGRARWAGMWGFEPRLVVRRPLGFAGVCCAVLAGVSSAVLAGVGGAVLVGVIIAMT